MTESLTTSRNVYAAVEIAHGLDALSKKEFGAPIAEPAITTSDDTAAHHCHAHEHDEQPTAPKPLKESAIQVPTDKDGLITRKTEAVPDTELVSLAANFNRLTAMAGSTFGLLQRQADGKHIIFVGMITSRTTPDQIHFTYINEPIDAKNLHRGLSPMQRIMLDGGGSLQDRSVGNSEVDQLVAKTATEPGHAFNAARALTDKGVMKNLEARVHLAHDWSDSEDGIAGELTKPSDTAQRGMFDLSTKDGKPRNYSFETEILVPSSRFALVRAESLERPVEAVGVSPTKIMLGVGVLAARQMHGNATDEMMLRAMDKM